jgi:hypothetical protein
MSEEPAASVFNAKLLLFILFFISVLKYWKTLHNEEDPQLVLFAKYYYNDKVKEAKMGCACSTYG